ncbi:MAG: DUF488 family protein [Candidatus Amulumruptor caecigallinarius]|nr:DUF488 family protein [Candidatus Amulumruptor caecigallinarius]MCM1397686.1 DUF488 family protein [Candidatus Amulumruptor caecigallinarius]MCM1454685.1 DUF488 family protein [bacterium]
MTKISIERVYADPSGTEGFRVFVDRLWPRGESKEKFHYDLWAKEVAPSTELREWLHADPDSRWEEFERRYTAELDGNATAKALADEVARHAAVTLLYSSRDTVHNNAEVLAEWLRRQLDKQPGA